MPSLYRSSNCITSQPWGFDLEQTQLCTSLLQQPIYRVSVAPGSSVITCIKCLPMSELLWIYGVMVQAPLEQTGGGMWCTCTSFHPCNPTNVASGRTATGRFIAPAVSDPGVVFMWICLLVSLHLTPCFSAQLLTRPPLDSSWSLWNQRYSFTVRICRKRSKASMRIGL